MGSVSSLSGQINSIDSEIDTVKGDVQDIRGQFDSFVNEFRKFVEDDLKARRLQNAEADVVNVQQEIEKRFSSHQTVRKYITGILQAADLSVVRADTLMYCVEALMLEVPRYWLVPCLIALSAWLNDQHELANRAIKEAVLRDDEKTSLLLALVCRRAGRNEAASIWLERFFSMQDPQAMQHKVLVVLDAYSVGLFGGDSKGMCERHLHNWISELEDAVGFTERQIDQWDMAIRLKVPSLPYESYTYLSKYASNWQEIRASLNRAHMHEEMSAYLRGILDAPIEEKRKFKDQLDRLLDSLVGNYDVEELPIRRKKQHLELIIEAKGDLIKADEAMAVASSAFDEQLDFSQLITNAAIQPELVGASIATQKLALSLAKDWMIAAYERVVDDHRSRVPVTVGLAIESWQGTTEDGTNEELLKEESIAHFDRKCVEKLATIIQSKSDYGWFACGLLVFIIGVFSAMPWPLVGLVALAGGALKCYLGYKKMCKTKEDTKRDYENIKEKAQQIIMACCAEVVDFRGAITTKEAEFEPLLDYMREITSHQFIATSAQTGRSIISMEEVRQNVG